MVERGKQWKMGRVLSGQLVESPGYNGIGCGKPTCRNDCRQFQR